MLAYHYLQRPRVTRALGTARDRLVRGGRRAPCSARRASACPAPLLRGPTRATSRRARSRGLDDPARRRSFAPGWCAPSAAATSGPGSLEAAPEARCGRGISRRPPRPTRFSRRRWCFGGSASGVAFHHGRATRWVVRRSPSNSKSQVFSRVLALRLPAEVADPMGIGAEAFAMAEELGRNDLELGAQQSRGANLYSATPVARRHRAELELAPRPALPRRRAPVNNLGRYVGSRDELARGRSRTSPRRSASASASAGQMPTILPASVCGTLRVGLD